MVWPQGLCVAVVKSTDADFCLAALKETLVKYGMLELFNANKASQFTNDGWIDVLTDLKIKDSIDDKGRWFDNRMIGDLSRSLKYKCVYLQIFEKSAEVNITAKIRCLK